MFRTLMSKYAGGIFLTVGVTVGLLVAGFWPNTPLHAVASDRGTDVVQRNCPGDRKRIRRFASTMALDMLRKQLM